MQQRVLGLAVCAWLFGSLGCGGAQGGGTTPFGSGGASGAGGAAGYGRAGSGGELSGAAGSGGQGGADGAGGAPGRDAGADTGDLPDASDLPDAGDASLDSGAVGDAQLARGAGAAISGRARRADHGASEAVDVRRIPGLALRERYADRHRHQSDRKPKGLLFFMQGGGACWDATMCLVTDKSAHLRDTVDQAVVLGEASTLSGLFDHDNAANPFANYAYVYMPYCTGDLHIGTQARTYTGPSGAETIHHQGGLNVEAYLKRIVATFPNVERVVVSGISAGGFGATLNWWRYQGAFPRARVTSSMTLG